MLRTPGFQGVRFYLTFGERKRLKELQRKKYALYLISLHLKISRIQLQASGFVLESLLEIEGKDSAW
jgi:hypothetical protein